MTIKISPMKFVDVLWDPKAQFECVDIGEEPLLENNPGPHTWDSHLISAARQGPLVCDVAKRSEVVEDGNALWVNALSKYHIHQVPGFEDTIKSWFIFKVRVDGEIVILNKEHTLIEANEAAKRLANELMPNMNLKSHYWEQQRQKSVLSAILSFIGTGSPVEAQEKKEGLFPNQVNALVEYVDEHIHERFYVEELAKHCKLHVNYLRSQFKKSFGMSLQAYIKKRRIEKASELMLHHNLKINQIASVMGYENDFFFSRQFKEIMGQSPSHWLIQEREKRERLAQ